MASAPVPLQVWIGNLHRGISEYFPIPEETSMGDLMKVLYWKEFDARRRGHEQVWEPRFAALLKKTAEQVGEAFKLTRSQTRAEAVVAGRMTPALTALMKDLYLEVERDFLKRLADSFRKKAEVDPGDPDSWGIIDPYDIPEMVEWNTLTMGAKITAISDATRSSIRRIIDQGLRDGTSVYDLVGRIAADFAFSRYRGYLIARTEVISASNAATHFGIGKNIPKDQTTKDWLATGDKRTRPTHITAGGNQKDIQFDKPFEVGGSLLMFPGDGSLGAAARETIQCRCTALYNYKPTAPPKPPPPPTPTLDDLRPLPSIPKPSLKPTPRPKPKPVEKVGKELRKEIEKRVGALTEEALRVERELEALRGRALNMGDVPFNKLEALRKELLRLQAAAREEIWAVLRLPDDVPRQKLAMKGLAKLKRDPDFLRRAQNVETWFNDLLADYRDGKPLNIKVNKLPGANDRAFASFRDKSINLSARDGQDVWIHEAGHLIEYTNKKLKNAMARLYKRRTAGESLRTMRELTGNMNYRDTEVAYKDKWIDPYCGKSYTGGTYTYGELTSMGVQYLFNDPLMFMKRDPELFEVLVGGLRSGIKP